MLLGFRRLWDRYYYADDPLIARALGVSKIPDVSTITRFAARSASSPSTVSSPSGSLA